MWLCGSNFRVRGVFWQPNPCHTWAHAVEFPIRYVHYGGADMGITGKDTLLEHGSQGLYQSLDLQIAKCRISVAVRSDFDYQSAVKKGSRLTVATKYVEISREFFASKGVHVDLIKLYGSMELAPPGRHGRCHR